MGNKVPLLNGTISDAAALSVNKFSRPTNQKEDFIVIAATIAIELLEKLSIIRVITKARIGLLYLFVAGTVPNSIMLAGLY